jgi:hypothetical protein
MTPSSSTGYPSSTAATSSTRRSSCRSAVGLTYVSMTTTGRSCGASRAHPAGSNRAEHYRTRRGAATATTDLAGVLLYIANDLEARLYPYSGAIRRGAARIKELEATAPTVDTCSRCGKPIDQKPLGRPRRFCSESCRRRKRVGNATVNRNRLL